MGGIIDKTHTKIGKVRPWLIASGPLTLLGIVLLMNAPLGLSAVFALVPEVVEYGYWKTGIRSEGLISSAQSIGSKIGIGLGSALTGWILAAVGYAGPAAEPTAAVVNAIRFDYTWLGAILGGVILVIVLLLNVEKYAPQYRGTQENGKQI